MQYTIKVSEAVCCAMQLDDPNMLKELGLPDDSYKPLKNGCKITGTLDELDRLAYHMTRESGWDYSPQMIYACNQAAKKLKMFIAEKRAGKDLGGK